MSFKYLLPLFSLLQFCCKIYNKGWVWQLTHKVTENVMVGWPQHTISVKWSWVVQAETLSVYVRAQSSIWMKFPQGEYSS